MKSFEDSPDANHHGGYSIMRELVVKKWRSRLLQPRTRFFLYEQRNRVQTAVELLAILGL
jgi:hypothetical protein